MCLTASLIHYLLHDHLKMKSSEFNQFNKANRPTMRPDHFALCVLRYAMVVVAEAAAVVAAVMVVAAVVVLLVVEESHGTILGLKIARFRRFLKRRNGHTDIRTYGRADPLIEMR